MNASGLLQKAERALASARLLLESGDVDGACNRAYYAMFDAAQAALQEANAPTVPEDIKTHSGLITAFSLHLVKTGRIPIEFGKALNRVADIRMVADYTGHEVDDEIADWAVHEAERFVAEVRHIFSSAASRGHVNGDD